MEAISEWFWNDDFWFVDGISFNDTICDEQHTYARPADLCALPIFGLGLRLMRVFYQHFIALPIGRWLNNIPDKGKHRLNGSANGDSFTSYKHTQNGVRSKTNGLHGPATTSRKKRRADKAEVAVIKFVETSWKCLLHTFLFTFGVCILVQSSWLWDNVQCAIGYPKHDLWPSLYYLYMFEGAYYISLLSTVKSDVKRKDWNMELIHHVAAICLISCSYATNQIRMGSLLMTLHRVADMLLQVTKLLLYAKYKTCANYMFVFFVAVFIFTRLYVYPAYLLHTGFIKWPQHVGYNCPWWYIGNAIALGLQVLHVLWAWIILKMAFKLRHGPLNRDDRSDTEDDAEDRCTMNGHSHIEEKKKL